MKPGARRPAQARPVAQVLIAFVVLLTAGVAPGANSGHASTPLSPPRGTAMDLWADKIIGQPRFTEIAPDATVANKTSQPHGTMFDQANGKFYVYDGGQNRILGVDDACITAAPCTAELVLGQPNESGQQDMTRAACNGDSAFQSYPKRAPASAAMLCTLKEDELSPSEAGSASSMDIDAQGNLYVVDYFNHRVLKYNNPFAPGEDIEADDVWGQNNFTANECNEGRGPTSPDNNSLCFSWGHTNNAGSGVDIDSQGNLWVVDTGNNRALRFPPFQPIGQKAANLVLGQPNFTSNSRRGLELNAFDDPAIVRVNTSGRVFITDNNTYNPATQQLNSRVLVFDNPTTNGQDGQLFLGKLNGVSGLEFDPNRPGKIWVAASNSLQLWPQYDPGASPEHVIGCTGGAAGNFLGHDWGSMGIDPVSDRMLVALGIGHYDNDVIAIPLAQSGCPSIFGGPGTWAPTRLFNMDERPVTKSDLGFAVVGVAITSGLQPQLIVAENGGGRILFWDSQPGLSLYDSLTSGAAASGCATIVQPVNAACSTRDPNCCISMQADRAGHLWVHTDRIYRYDLPLTQGEGPSQTIFYPIPALDGTQVAYAAYGWGIAPSDDGSQLWVIQGQGNRAFRIRNAMTSPTVDVVLGQTSTGAAQCNRNLDVDLDGRLGESGPPLSTDPNNFLSGDWRDDTLCLPGAISLDRFGNVWVADHSLEISGNGRLLRFDAGLFPVNNPSMIFGPNASKSLPNLAPWQPAIDSQNHLVVGWNRWYGGNPKAGASAVGDNGKFPGIYIRPLVSTTTRVPDAQLKDFYSMGFSAAFDAQDNLYMADLNRARVLVYKRPIPARVTNVTAEAISATQWSLSWPLVEGVAGYQACVTYQPNPGGNWICAPTTTNTTSVMATPSTSSKAVYFFAVRALAPDGRVGAFSNRVTFSTFNETLSGVPYNSYHIAYKNSSGTKMVNGFNRHASASRWLAFSNITPSQDIKSLVAASSKWFGAATPWTAPDWLTFYGPLIDALESPNSSLSPSDFMFQSTYCMVAEIMTGCE